MSSAVSGGRGVRFSRRGGGVCRLCGPCHCYRGPPHFGENFRGLVLGCMGTYDSESWRIFSHFSRSTRFPFLCTARHSNICHFLLSFLQFVPSNFFFFENFESISNVFTPILMKISRNFMVLKKIHKNLTKNLTF